jgi:hypothetical protein
LPDYPELRSTGVAAVLAFFVPGLGHFYVGRFRRGILFLGGVPLGLVALGLGSTVSIVSTAPDLLNSFVRIHLLMILLGLLFVVSHLVQMIDAHRCALQANRLAWHDLRAADERSG